MAGAAGGAGAPDGGTGGTGGEMTIAELCAADCANQALAECDGFTTEYCEYLCEDYYDESCDEEYRAWVECDAATAVEDYGECYNGGPTPSDDCYPVLSTALVCLL